MLNKPVTLIFIVLSLLGVLGFGLKTWRDQNRIYELILASGDQSGEYYAFSQAFADVVNENQHQIHIEVIETQGSAENMMRLNNEQAQLALIQSDTRVERPVRAVARLYPEMFHLLVRTDANIETAADLNGKKIALMPEGSGSYSLFWSFIEHYGIQPEEVMANPMSASSAFKTLQAGEVHALFIVIGPGNSSIRDVLQDESIELIGIDQVEALRLSLPYLEAQTIPRGTYNGDRPVPAQDLPVVAVNALLVTHEKVPNQVVKVLTSTLYNHRNELVSRYPRAALIRLPDAGSDLGLTLHPGAQAFYDRDEPEFIVEYAESIGLLLSVVALIGSGLWQLHSRLIGHQKNRADRYNLEILQIIEQINQADNIQELEDLQKHLFTILRKVVNDFDLDRISGESFEAFSIPWEIAMNSLRYQESALSNKGAQRETH